MKFWAAKSTDPEEGSKEDNEKVQLKTAKSRIMSDTFVPSLSISLAVPEGIAYIQADYGK